MFYSIDQINKVYKKDFIKWVNRIHIIGKGFGDPIPLKLNISQKRVVQELNNFSVLLKPRQIGGTTLMMALIIYFADRIKNSNHGVISYDIINARWQLQRIKDIVNSIPEEFGIEIDKERSNRDMLTFKHSGSRIVTGSGGADNFALGTTMFSILATEAPKWTKDRTSFMSFIPTIVKGGFCFMESTPYGTGNLFHELYVTAKEHPPVDERQFKNIFVPWYEVPEFRVQPPEPITYTKDEKELIEKYSLDDQQLYWRRLQMPGYPNHSQRSYSQFCAWYPTDDETCWLETSSSPFDMNMAQKLQVKTPIIGRYGEKIYESPCRDKKYFMGVDTSLGKQESDEMAITIIDKEANVVCVFNDRINYAPFMRIAVFLMNWYKPHVFVELTGGYGFRVYEEMKVKKEYGIQVSEFQTNEVSKQLMFNRIDEWIGQVKMACDAELKSQILKYNQLKKDNKDDVLMSFGMALSGMMNNKTMPWSITVPKKEEQDVWSKIQQKNLSYRRY